MGTAKTQCASLAAGWKADAHPGADELPHVPMAKSDLEVFTERERPDLAAEVARNRELARELDVFGQATLAGWCELAQVAERTNLLNAHGKELLAYYSAEADGYEPRDPDPSRYVTAIYFAATLSGLAEDVKIRRVRLDELQTSLAQLHRLVERAGDNQGSLYGGATFGVVLGDPIAAGLDPTEIDPGAACVIPWQRLAWLAECRMRGGAILSRARAEPLVGDSYEQLTYLLRLAANQPGLGNWPELARFVPRRAEGLLPLSEEAYRRFRREGIPDDPELARRLVDEIVNRRHYILDLMSVIELEEMGIHRIIMTPEERPESEVKEYEPQFIAGFLIDHVAGAFAGTITIGGNTGDGRNASVMVPALFEQTGRAIEASGVAASHDIINDMRALHEAQAAVELILLSAWRDLVVPDVRDEQYEIDRIRKVKGRGGKRATKRGNLEIIRYVPRRLVYRRAAAEAAQQEGRKEPRLLYAVGAFARRLPQGQKRSAEADVFANEIGIPLADHQTVVQPHFRGGAEEEREVATEVGAGLTIKRWKSWSALDLLRTREAQLKPDSARRAD